MAEVNERFKPLAFHRGAGGSRFHFRIHVWPRRIQRYTSMTDGTQFLGSTPGYDLLATWYAPGTHPGGAASEGTSGL